SAMVRVEFREAVNVDSALNDVQRAVGSIRRDLPSEVEEPTYAKLDLNDVPVTYLAVTSDGQGDDTRLFRVADELVRPRVERASGVGRVALVGGREPEVQVELLPDRLRAYGLSISDVASAVRNQFLSVSGGDVRSGGGEQIRQSTLRIDGRGAKLDALGSQP